MVGAESGCVDYYWAGPCKDYKVHITDDCDPIG